MLVRGIGVILLSSVLFGAMAVCVRAASRAMPAGQIAFIRFLGSLLVLLALRRGRSLRPVGPLPRVLVRGLLGGAAIVLYYRGIEGAGAGLATLLHCTYPIWTALFATTIMRERFDLPARHRHRALPRRHRGRRRARREPLRGSHARQRQRPRRLDARRRRGHHRAPAPPGRERLIW